MIPDDFAFPCANTYLINQELEETVNKFGSLITLFSNKPVSCVTMFIILQKHPVLQQSLVDLSETTWFDVVEYLAHRYPVLNKTKKIK